MVVEGRLDVRLIDKATLQRYMQFRGQSLRSLGEAVDREVRKSSKGKVVPKASWRVIAHLHSGERNTCHPLTAAAIERCLEAPPGSMFVPTVSRVSRPHKTPTKEAA